MLLPSLKYKEWHEKTGWIISSQSNHHTEKPTKKCTIDIEFIMPDKRRADMDNKASSILDLLVDNGVIEDDSFFCVTALNLQYKGINKEKAGAKITIKEVV